MMTRQILVEFVREASNAPSVHNIQPTRWQIEDDRLIVLRDTAIRLPHADPGGHDVMVSMGAAIEGVAIAASRRGFSARFRKEEQFQTISGLRQLGDVVFEATGEADPLADHVDARCSWRGQFVRASQGDRALAAELSGDGCAVFTSVDELTSIGHLADSAGMSFMGDDGFRNELISWMRLRRSNPRWSLDGLNAEAMHMNPLEAWAASIVLGPAFGLLNRLGLAGKLLSEWSRFPKAAGVMIVHRPVGEDPVDSGRHFYRSWLSIAKSGFAAQVVAALADETQARDLLHKKCKLGADRRILTAFVFGTIPEKAKRAARARLPLETLIVNADAPRGS